MATYKELSSADIKTSRSVLNQLIDVIQEDISGSSTRKKYQVFVTGGIGPGVTSSLFHTVYDQDFSLQTANPIFDITMGIYSGSGVVATASSGIDSAGKLLFPSQTLMMREKINLYRQFAQMLLGDATYQFTTPFGTTQPPSSGGIDTALFICFKRLFARDEIKRETFAMKMFQSASKAPYSGFVYNHTDPEPNLNLTTTSGSAIYTDVGSATAREMAVGGEVGNLVNSADTSNKVGTIFYDQGIVVLDMTKVISGSQHVSGVIDAMSNAAYQAAAIGQTVLGGALGNYSASFIPDLIVSASMDDILDHVCSTRFSSGSLTAMTFQNVTNINSTLLFCRATSDEFNYSSNPTFTDDTGRIRVIDEGEEITQRVFSFVTTIGLYDARNNLLAVAKLSRPVEKNDEKDITMRIRLDF
tara:strand:- start:6067 stop:7311 length:1245 start_codon:yes stop_codon:yes gene_type:complete